jgi:hypothetical protein
MAYAGAPSAGVSMRPRPSATRPSIQSARHPELVLGGQTVVPIDIRLGATSTPSS